MSNFQKNINKACPQRIKHSSGRRGFVILFAVTISAILLSVALGVANIAFKEVRFGTSARGTNEAFFAADTGIECALFFDKSAIDVFTVGNNPSLTCNNHTFVATEERSSFWRFVLSGLGSGTEGCAIVTVDKTSPFRPTTTIIAKGYNNGGSVPDLCTLNSNTIEREIKVSY